MMEKSVWIQVGEGREKIKLEGRLYLAESGLLPNRGVVICHPHPLYGGDMDNGVVIAIQRAFAGEGFSTLRFNFRGVGASGGSYDDGVGEVDDLVAACGFMRDHGVSELFGAGYSFGSWILLRGYHRENFKGLVLVSPPLGVMDFRELELPSTVPCLIISGSRDEFCPMGQLEAWINKEKSSLNKARHHIIEGENHFFWRSLDKLGEIVRKEIKLWSKE